jgi:predicted transcriptional regulator
LLFVHSDFKSKCVHGQTATRAYQQDPMTDKTILPPSLTSYVGQIVAAYVSNNEVATRELLDLIKTVHVALIRLQSSAVPMPDALVPAVPIKKSIFPDHIVCLEDGKSFKMIKRHLLTDHGMTPEHYRERWGLPATYPMVSPNHAGVRSALAKKIRLGQKQGVQEAVVEVEEEGAADIELLVKRIPAGKRGGKQKADTERGSDG